MIQKYENEREEHIKKKNRSNYENNDDWWKKYLNVY